MEEGEADLSLKLAGNNFSEDFFSFWMDYKYFFNCDVEQLNPENILRELIS